LDIVLLFGFAIGVELKVLFFPAVLIIAVVFLIILALIHLEIFLAAGRPHLLVQVFRFLIVVFLLSGLLLL